MAQRRMRAYDTIPQQKKPDGSYRRDAKGYVKKSIKEKEIVDIRKQTAKEILDIIYKKCCHINEAKCTTCFNEWANLCWDYGVKDENGTK